MATFVDNLVPLDVIHYLMSGEDSVLSYNEVQRLNLQTKDEITGAQDLMDKIMKKDDKKILLFKEILNKHGYDFLAELLKMSDEVFTPQSTKS